MKVSEVLSLGFGVTLPWRLEVQHLGTSKSPQELHLHVECERGTSFTYPECGRSCKAPDFGKFRWRHLNFFPHHRCITARVSRTDCPGLGVERVRVPWAREGNGFTLLFEQAAPMLSARCQC
jgi:hypothetical protein